MFTYKRRVTFYETDGMKVVHHANYLKYFEEARVEYLRAGGLDLNELMEEGIVFPIVEVSVKYLKSACYDDTLLIRTYLRCVDRVRLDFDYEVVRESTGELLTTGAYGQYVHPYEDRPYRASSEGKDRRPCEALRRRQDIMDNRPIGIMDSGIGGLTVARVLHETYPEEGIVFLGDTKRNPYGERSRDDIVRFSFAIKDFLKEHQVKMILIACNTISFNVPPAFF